MKRLFIIIIISLITLVNPYLTTSYAKSLPNLTQVINAHSHLKNRYRYFNVNSLVHETNLKSGDIVSYIPDNNTYILSHVPKNETDNQYPLDSNPMRYNQTTVKVIQRATSSFHQVYYQVQFKDGLIGWVPSNYLTLTLNHPIPAEMDMQTASQFWALNYLNYLRFQHHLLPIIWDWHLANIAHARVAQLPIHFEHYDDEQFKYADTLARSMGYDTGMYTGIGENIARLPLVYSPKVAIINIINAMMYNDEHESHWSHRQNFLDPNTIRIGIAMSENNGNYYVSFNFI